jgi:hypothetical protein
VWEVESWRWRSECRGFGLDRVGKVSERENALRVNKEYFKKTNLLHCLG